MPTIHNKLGEILENKGMTASQLAERCFVNRATISNIINNNFNPSLKLLFRISNALNMSIHDIFFFEEDEL